MDALVAEVQPDELTTVVHLFDGPYLTTPTSTLAIPPGGQRLVSYLALHRRRIERAYVSGMLWPDGDDVRAAGNLRCTLFRLHRAGVHVVEADKWSVWLGDDVQVDVQAVSAWADGVLRGDAELIDSEVAVLPADVFELLPECDDEWVVVARERVQQRLLHALEELASRLCEQERYAEAVEVIRRALRHRPLRESAQAILLEVYTAQGHHAQALEAYRSFAALLRRELGVEPSRRLHERLRHEAWYN